MRGLALFVAACAAACGPLDGVPDAGTGFSVLALTCQRAGMQALLQIQDHPDCLLEADEGGFVGGECPGIAAGGRTAVRLVYYAMPDDQPRLELAVGFLILDLRKVTESEQHVAFDVSDLDLAMDDDGDGLSNLVEWCEGSDPRGP